MRRRELALLAEAHAIEDVSAVPADGGYHVVVTWRKGGKSTYDYVTTSHHPADRARVWRSLDSVAGFLAGRGVFDWRVRPAGRS